MVLVGVVTPDADAADRVDGIELRDILEPSRTGQLLELYAQTSWAADRTGPEVGRMLAASDLIFALIDQPADRLVGFARVLTDETYLAIVLDVVVASDYRQRGLGRMLLDAIVSHPRLVDIESLELVCQPDVIPFYGRWGFTDAVGESRLLRRCAPEARSGSDES
jgi:GNAT superfamily N-acetyltransferase